MENLEELQSIITDKAREFGADMAGIVNLHELRCAPAYQITPRIGYYADGDQEKEREIRREPSHWPEGAKSALVIAIEHPAGEPQLDWWQTKRGSVGNTEGNRQLIRTMAELAEWLQGELGIRFFKIPYNVESGGVFMKDAAVLAGLGCIGKNNILVTPEFGPRVRLRVLLLAKDLPSTGVVDFDPCADCAEPCRRVCPQEAFAEQLYTPEEFGLESLPGQSGVYNRQRCNIQMVKNESEAVVADGGDAGVGDASTMDTMELVKYCRKCELACPVGSA